MFCEKCGKPTEGEQFLCADCAAEVIPEEVPVQAEVPAQPVESAPETELLDDTFELGLAEDETPAPKKKKKKKGLVIGIIAGVVAVLGVVIALCWSTIWTFFCRTFMSPEDYLVMVETKAVAQHTASLSSAYGKWRSGVASNANATSGTINLVVGDELISLAEMTLAQQSGEAIDLDWLSEISFSVDSNFQDNAFQTILGLNLGKQDILSLDAIFDFENGMYYMTIPEINKKYLSMEMPADMDWGEVQSTYAASLEAVQVLAEDMPSEEAVNEMLNKYVDIVLSEIKNVEKSTKTVKVGGVSQSMTVLTAKITEEDLLNILQEVLKEAEDDKTLKQFIKAYGTYLNTTYQLAYGDSYNVDLYANFTDSIPDLIDQLEEAKETADKSNYLKLYTYVDMQGNVRGHELVTYSDGKKGEEELSYLTVKKGDTIYIEAKLGKLEIEGEKTEKKGVSSGELEFTAQGLETFTIEFEDVTDSSATIRLCPSEEMLNEMMAGSGLPSTFLSNNMALELVLGTSSNPNYIAVNLLLGNDVLVGLNISAEAKTGGDITVPSQSYDVTSQTDFERWLASADLDAIVDALEDADLPDEILDVISYYVDNVNQYLK